MNIKWCYTIVGNKNLSIATNHHPPSATNRNCAAVVQCFMLSISQLLYFTQPPRLRPLLLACVCHACLRIFGRIKLSANDIRNIWHRLHSAMQYFNCWFVYCGAAFKYELKIILLICHKFNFSISAQCVYADLSRQHCIIYGVGVEKFPYFHIIPPLCSDSL